MSASSSDTLRVHFPDLWECTEHFQRECTPGGAGLVPHIPMRDGDAVQFIARSVARKLGAHSAMCQLTSMNGILVAFLIEVASDYPFRAMCASPTHTSTMRSAILGVAKWNQCNVVGDPVILNHTEATWIRPHGEHLGGHDTADPPAYSTRHWPARFNPHARDGV